jgi:predicted glutamine amidotransferase
MCRLFTVINTENNDEINTLAKKVFTHGLLSSESKTNDDGTGAALLVDNKQFVVKSFLPAHEFCFREEYLSMLMKANGPIFLGHTRNATAGTTVDGKHRTVNAHPFRYGNIIGAHNGIFHYDSTIIEEPALAGAEIDSAVFFALLAKEVGDKTEITPTDVNIVIHKFTSTAFACLVLNTLNPDWLYILRGVQSLSLIKSGPLTIVATEKDDILNSLYFLKLMLVPQLWAYEAEEISLPMHTMFKLNIKTGELVTLGTLDTVYKAVYTPTYGRFSYGWGDEEDDEHFFGVGSKEESTIGASKNETGSSIDNRLVGQALYFLAKKAHMNWREVDILCDYLCDDLATLSINDVKAIMELIPQQIPIEAEKIWSHICTFLGKKGIPYIDERYNYLSGRFGKVVTFPWTMMALEDLQSIEKALSRDKYPKGGKEKNK